MFTLANIALRYNPLRGIYQKNIPRILEPYTIQLNNYLFNHLTITRNLIYHKCPNSVKITFGDVSSIQSKTCLPFRMTAIQFTKSIQSKSSFIKSPKNFNKSIPYFINQTQRRTYFATNRPQHFSDQIRYQLRTNVIFQLAAVNLGVFLLWQTIGVTSAGHHFMMNNFTVSASNIAKGRLWTLFTSEISHFNLMHFIFNMLAMITIGDSVRQTIGNKRTLSLYLIGSFCASIAHIFWTFAQFRKAISKQEKNLTLGDRNLLLRGPPAGLGASGAVCAIIGAFAVLWPRKRLNFLFFMNPKASTVVVAICIFDFIGLWNQNSILGHSGHLGGVLSGVLFAVILRRFHRI